MRLLSIAGIGLTLSCAAFAQNLGDEAVIAGRQREIVRQAELSGIDLGHGDWQHVESPVCPAFTHHVFVLYRRGTMAGVRTSFIAILPRQMGRIGTVRIVPLTGNLTPGGWTAKPLPAIERAETAETFNAVWSEELEAAGHPNVFPGLSWAQLAECYLRMGDERPATAPDNGRVYPPDPVDLSHPIRSMLMPVASGSPAGGSVSVSFDSHGMVSSATQSGHPGFQWNPFRAKPKPQPVASVQ